MIYVSTSCLKDTPTIEAVKILQKNGIRNIELSGCQNYYNGLDGDLIKFKAKYDLNYTCHNYFLPAKEPFVLNLASLNNDIYPNTLRYLKSSIKLSNELNSKKFGFHAGFFVDIKVEEVGNKLNLGSLFNKKKSMQKFCDGFNILKKEANGLELYIENNVISYTNLETFNGVNPFMMTNHDEYVELRKHIDFKLLLDIGHLKVSANSLNLDFEDELNKLIAVSDYLHISDNDGLSDQNKHFSNSCSLLKILKNCNLKNKIITMEVYGNMQKIKESYNLLRDVIY
jgi:sugar phosphate isomerase/epimerase